MLDVRDGSMDPYVSLRLFNPVDAAALDGKANRSSVSGSGQPNSLAGSRKRGKDNRIYVYQELYEQSSTQPFEDNPLFNEKFKFANISPDSKLVVEVWDVPTKSSQSDVVQIGSCTIDIKQVAANRVMYGEYDLKPPVTEQSRRRGQFNIDDVRGKVIMRLQWQAFAFERPRTEDTVPSAATVPT